MATNNTPNMNLPLPVTAQESGPAYANDVNNCFTTVDQHNHAAGSGVQINPNGININGDLPFNGNNATTLRSASFTPQGSPLSGAADIGCLYEVGADLYYNDGSGNQVRITQSGGVAGSPGSIANLASPASASYVSANQTFVWQSAASTAANLDAGSLILRNITSGSNGLTLSPPSSLASNYTITLPTLPVSQSFMTINSSGSVAAPVALSQGITASNIANATITGTQIANATITGTQLAAFPFFTGSATNFTTALSTTPVLVTGLSVTATSTGRRMFIEMQSSSNSAGPSPLVGCISTGGTAGVILYKDGSPFKTMMFSSGPIAASTFKFIDSAPTAGSHTYQIYIFSQGSSSSAQVVFNCQLVAYEY